MFYDLNFMNETKNHRPMLYIERVLSHLSSLYRCSALAILNDGMREQNKILNYYSSSFTRVDTKLKN